MSDLEKTKLRCAEIKQRVINAVGEMDGIEFLILMLLLWKDASLELIDNDNFMKSYPKNIQKACRIIIEELQKDQLI